MKDQVTNLEQSQRLLELGIPAYKASMVYVNNSDIPSFREELVSAGIDLQELKEDGHEYTPAFTITDLLEVMPPYIEIANASLPGRKLLKVPEKGNTQFQFHIWKGGAVGNGV